MKRFILAFLILAMMGFASTLPLSGRAETVRRDEAVVEFPDTVKLVNVLLKGRYRVVHDEARMAEGFPCLYVYGFKDGQANDLVVSFHCQHQERQTANKFTVTLSNRKSPYDLPEVQELQFAGSADGHGVPK
ncbi:MAG: hypothetical protein HY231_07515 [Acidobacteria bacterium]|nr:hypothetical protein [Acidobacteriota bacterium]